MLGLDTFPPFWVIVATVIVIAVVLSVRRFIPAFSIRPEVFDAEVLALAGRCAAVIRGELPGRMPDGKEYGALPYYGKARIDGSWLFWSAPNPFDMERLKSGFYVPVHGLRDVYLWTGSQDHAVHAQPRLCLIIGGLNVWATLWPEGVGC